MLSDAERAAAQPIDIPRAEPKMAMQVIGIPLPQPGLYAVEIASTRLGQALHAEDKPYYVSGGALVTNLAVHFKHGRESSLAWVTRLDDGKPVSGAQVRVTDCLGKRWWDGATDANGIARIERELPRQNRWQDCPHAANAYLVSARIDGDMSLMLTSWNEGIRPWQFNLGGGSEAEPVIAHTVFDRALFRAGETVSMKHVIRRRVGTGFAAVETRNLPRQLQLIHSGSGQRFDLPITWNNGTALNTWSIPKDAKLGEYTVLFIDPRPRCAIARRFVPRRTVSRAADEGRAEAAIEVGRQREPGHDRCAVELPVRRACCRRAGQVSKPHRAELTIIPGLRRIQLWRRSAEGRHRSRSAV